MAVSRAGLAWTVSTSATRHVEGLNVTNSQGSVSTAVIQGGGVTSATRHAMYTVSTRCAIAIQVTVSSSVYMVTMVSSVISLAP